MTMLAPQGKELSVSPTSGIAAQSSRQVPSDSTRSPQGFGTWVKDLLSSLGWGLGGLFEHRQAAHHFLVEVIDFLVQVADFELGFEVHLILDVVAHPVARDLPVLAEQHEYGQDDGFQ